MLDREGLYAEAFERDGFVVVDNHFEPLGLNQFKRALLSLPGRLDVGERYDLAAQMPEFLRLVSDPCTHVMANLLLRRRAFAPLYCYTNRCRIDPPLDDRRTYGWHQELFYTMPETRFVQTWAPLVADATVENGTIEVCVGSHREGMAPQKWADPAGRAPQILVDKAVVARYEQRAIPMKLGQMLFFDGRLIHRSGRNTSRETRYSLVGMYHDVDAPGFRAPKIVFEYRGATPREHYEACAPHDPAYANGAAELYDRRTAA